MDSELPRTQGHHFDASDLSGNPAELNSGVEGHSEKPSMLKRVQAKAKKIKNTLTSHEHDHDHDHSQSHEEDEEMVEDTEIHGAPIYESAADKGATRASGGQPATGGTNSDTPSMVDPRYDSPMFDQETRPSVQRQVDEDRKKLLLKEDKHAPAPGRDVYEERENPDQVGGPNAMEGNRDRMGTTNHQVDSQGPDIRAHPSNDQIKTIDPAAGRGREEAEGLAPVTKLFNEMGISEEKPKPEHGNAAGLYTGSHNQFDPEPVPSESSDSVSKGYNDANPRDMPLESSESFPKSYNSANPQDMPKDVVNPASQSSTYTEKITSASAAASSAIAGTAQSAKNVIASKIGQMSEPGEYGKPGEGNKSGSVMGTAGDYTNKIVATVTGTLAPVYGKVVGVGSGATSKASGLGSETAQESSGSVGQDKGVSGLGAETTRESGGSVGQDKGVSRKPGEEDTESFSKPNGEKMEEVPSSGGGERNISQIVSDAVHEREPEESDQKRPMGKVTESEEVAKRLGTGQQGSGPENVGSGGGVVSKLTGVIGSWLGGQGGRAQSTPGTTLADDNQGDTGKKKKNADAQGVTEERRLQESTN